ncbi:MAG: SDR family NAD(P)-dependent oxidoreductase [Actinophytocola sp.]|nr:SDR family NAD(P)-dependent oxidoreductase [Actinophytocola sp.]
MALVAQIEGAGGRAVAVVGDVKEETLAEKVVGVSVERFGGLDIAFNNAGLTGEVGPSATLTLQQWHDTLETVHGPGQIALTR